MKRKSIPRLLATSLWQALMCISNESSLILQFVLAELSNARTFLTFFFCPPHCSDTNNLVKFPYEGREREEGSNFTQGSITLFYSILFFQAIPYCPGLPT